MEAATGFLNRLKIWQKLALVAAAFAVPLALTTYFLLDEKSIKIDFAQWEMYGDEYLRPCGRLLANLAADEALAHRRAAGDATAQSKLVEARARIDRDFMDLAAVDRRLSGRLETTLDGLRIRQREAALPSTLHASWERLKSESSDAKASDGLHERLIADLRTLITHIGDTSKLILDPDLDTYYQMDALLLREPELVDRLHALGATVTGILERKTITEEERATLAGAIALIEFHTDGLAADAATTIHEAPNFSKHAGIEAALTGRVAEASAATRAAIELTRSSMINPETIGVSAGQIADAVSRAIDANVAYWNVLLNQQDEMLKIRMHGDMNRRTFALWSTLGAVVLTLLLTVLIMRSITLPIAKAVEVANRLSRGELPENVEVGSATDETGLLLRAINDMLKFLDLRRTITTLKDTARILSGAISELEKQVAEQDQAASRQAAALQETQVTSQQIRQTSRLASEKAATVLQVAERADVVSRMGEAAVEKSVGGLTEIRSQADQIATKIEELNQRTQQIGVITQTVKDLADQSNMLALNAAIEAVRSGEHGKGFAVVAREIRSLADQSIHATNRVNEILETVSSSIRSAVGITDVGRQKMEASLVEVRTSGDGLRELSGIVRESSQSARQIAAAVSQQDAGVNEIFRAIGEQSNLMDEMVKRVEGTRGAITDVRNGSEQIAELVARFRV